VKLAIYLLNIITAINALVNVQLPLISAKRSYEQEGKKGDIEPSEHLWRAWGGGRLASPVLSQNGP